MWSQKAVSDIVNFKVFLGEGMGTTCPRSPLLSLSPRTRNCRPCTISGIGQNANIAEKEDSIVAHSCKPFEGDVR